MRSVRQWIFNLAYLGAFCAWLPVLVLRRLTGHRWGDWGQKLFGSVPQRETVGPCLWLHAVSVGEVLLLRPVISELSQAHPNLEFRISTTTATGQQVARDTFPHAVVFYFPLDFTWAVRRALRRVHPTAVALVELELWPNFIDEVATSGIPLVLINGRLGARSFRGYQRIRNLVGRCLNTFSLLTIQTEEYAQRLRELGGPAERMLVTGSVKYDGVPADRGNPQTAALRQRFQLRDDELVFIAGSTQAPEEELALAAYQTLRAEFPTLRLIIVPRHQERFDSVATLMTDSGMPLDRRSRPDAVAAVSGNSNPPVILLDTLGELGACWGLADIAFVGGSLSQRGGQNMIEPAAYGAAVLFGPNTFNFRQPVELLLSQDAARVVPSGEDLVPILRDLLADPAARQAMGQRARTLVQSQQGATRRIVEALQPFLTASDS